MSNPKKDRAIAVVGTILVHALVLLVLFLMAFRTPLPLPGEAGVEVDLGMYNQGMGEVQPEKPEVPQQPEPPAVPQEVEEVPEIKEDIVTQETEEAPAITQQTVNPKALFKGADKPQETQSEGNTNQPGDQGNPNGLAGVKKYDGQGGQGDGPGYDLGGRGATTLQRPPREFPEEGHIVVEIWVDRQGNVVRTGIAKGTDITNSEMRGMALEAARRSRFAPDPNAPEEQKGTITYTFVQNQ